MTGADWTLLILFFAVYMLGYWMGGRKNAQDRQRDKEA